MCIDRYINLWYTFALTRVQIYINVSHDIYCKVIGFPNLTDKYLLWIWKHHVLFFGLKLRKHEVESVHLTLPPHIFSVQVKSGACYITVSGVHNKIRET